MSELETWLTETEAQWADIPEYKVDPDKLKHLARTLQHLENSTVDYLL